MMNKSHKSERNKHNIIKFAKTEDIVKKIYLPYVRMSVCPYVRMSVCPYVRMYSFLYYDGYHIFYGRDLSVDQECRIDDQTALFVRNRRSVGPTARQINPSRALGNVPHILPLRSAKTVPVRNSRDKLREENHMQKTSTRCGLQR